jgi:hypothetical protein
MLSNATYTARTYSESRRDKTGYVIQAPWPAIIDDGMFARVQDRLKRLTPQPSKFKRTGSGNHPKRKQNPKTAHPFVFRGLLWCHECQRRFVGQHSNGQTRYFCGSRETTQPCQHTHSIREAQFLPWVDDLMTGLERGHLEDLLMRERGLRLRKPLIAKETAAGTIEGIDRRIKNMNIKLDNETVTPAEFKAEIESLRRQRRIYEAQLQEQPNPKLVGRLGRAVALRR